MGRQRILSQKHSAGVWGRSPALEAARAECLCISGITFLVSGERRLGLLLHQLSDHVPVKGHVHHHG